MANKNKKQNILTKASLFFTAIKAQTLSNLLFGLPMIMVFLFFEGISTSGVFYIFSVYMIFYLALSIPFYGILPIFFSRKTRKVLQKINAEEAIEQGEVSSAIRSLMEMPYRTTLFVFIASMASFIIGTLILTFWLVPNFIFLLRREVFIFSGILIGFVVSIVHLLLNYIYFEDRIRGALESLVSRISDQERSRLKFTKIPLFNKILFVIFLSVIATQFSVIGSFLTHVGINTPNKFLSVAGYVSIVAFMTIIFIFIIAVNFTKNLVLPLQKIINWAGTIAKGGKEQKINILTNDEISEVVDYSREMVKELETGRTVLEIKVEARTRELRELAESLDSQIKERTSELRKKIDELERFQRVTVGRELQMIELKKEITALKEQLGGSPETQIKK